MSDINTYIHPYPALKAHRQKRNQKSAQKDLAERLGYPMVVDLGGSKLVNVDLGSRVNFGEHSSLLDYWIVGKTGAWGNVVHNVVPGLVLET